MTTRDFFLVKPDYAAVIWHSVRPLIEKTLVHAEGEMNSSDSLRLILNEDQQLWLGVEDEKIFLALITEIISYPKKNTLRIINFSTETEHDMDTWYEKAVSILSDFALKFECTNLEAWCRKGFAKKLDWEHEYVVISKPVTPKQQQRKRRRRPKNNG